jgi:mannose-1-phosphate guanylyltransferase
MNADVYAVIMAGGSGTRFWPVSRAATPKQLTRIIGDRSMIQATVERLHPLVPAANILVVTTAQLAEETRRQLPALKPEHVIAEPVGRDTAAAVCLAAIVVERLSPGASMLLLPADHLITPPEVFQQALAAGIAEARQGALVTYGITPRHPATGYGYVQLGDPLPGRAGAMVNRVKRFVEKPDAATAQQYLADGGYRWNSGIFTWKSDVVLAELGEHCPWLTEAMSPVARAWGTPEFDATLDRVYGPLRRISIDYALMEKAKHIHVVTGDFAWDDLGSWDALYDHLPRDERGMVLQGPAVAIDCRDSLLTSHSGQMIVGIGLDGLTVVATRDAILIVPKGRSQEVKKAVEALKERGRTDLL